MSRGDMAKQELSFQEIESAVRDIGMKFDQTLIDLLIRIVRLYRVKVFLDRLERRGFGKLHWENFFDYQVSYGPNSAGPSVSLLAEARQKMSANLAMTEAEIDFLDGLDWYCAYAGLEENLSDLIFHRRRFNLAVKLVGEEFNRKMDSWKSRKSDSEQCVASSQFLESQLSDELRHEIFGD